MFCKRHDYTPTCDALELRLALTTGGGAAVDAILSPAEYAATLRKVDRSLIVLARTGNEVRADAILMRAVASLPTGGEVLPELRENLAEFSPGVRGSASRARRQLRVDLDAFVREGVASGTIAVGGALRSRFGGPVGSPTPGPGAPPGSSPGATSFSFTAESDIEGGYLRFLVIQGGQTLSTTRVFGEGSAGITYTPQGSGPVRLVIQNPYNGGVYFDRSINPVVERVEVRSFGDIRVIGPPGYFVAQNQTDQDLRFLITQDRLTLNQTTVRAGQPAMIAYDVRPNAGLVRLDIFRLDRQSPIFEQSIDLSVDLVQVNANGNVSLS